MVTAWEADIDGEDKLLRAKADGMVEITMRNPTKPTAGASRRTGCRRVRRRACWRALVIWQFSASASATFRDMESVKAPSLRREGDSSAVTQMPLLSGLSYSGFPRLLGSTLRSGKSKWSLPRPTSGEWLLLLCDRFQPEQDGRGRLPTEGAEQAAHVLTANGVFHHPGGGVAAPCLPAQ